MSTLPILLYGASGRLGRLVRTLAAERGIEFIAAGRGGARIGAPGDRGDARVFGLAAPSAVDANLRGVKVVVNCAGPAGPARLALFEACLRCGVDYLDVSDDLSICEAYRAAGEAIMAAEIMVIPAVGLSAVASECLALQLAGRLPQAQRLDLVFWDAARSSTERLAAQVIKDHRLTGRSDDTSRCRFSDDHETRFATPIATADLCVVHTSTQVPNIAIWRAETQGDHWTRRVIGALPLSARIKQGGLSVVGLAGKIRAQLRGSPAATSKILGVATGPSGESIKALLETPDRLVFTAHAALQIALRVAAGARRPGFVTTGALLGADFALTLPGVNWA